MVEADVVEAGAGEVTGGGNAGDEKEAKEGVGVTAEGMEVVAYAVATWSDGR